MQEPRTAKIEHGLLRKVRARVPLSGRARRAQATMRADVRMPRDFEKRLKFAQRRQKTTAKSQAQPIRAD